MGGRIIMETFLTVMLVIVLIIAVIFLLFAIPILILIGIELFGELFDTMKVKSDLRKLVRSAPTFEYHLFVHETDDNVGDDNVPVDGEGEVGEEAISENGGEPGDENREP